MSTKLDDQFESQYEDAFQARKTKRIITRFAIFICIIILTFVCSMVSYRYVYKSIYEGAKIKEIKIAKEDRIVVHIPIGAGTSKIADLLKENDVINNTYMFKLKSYLSGYDGKYQAGTHYVSKKLSYEDIMAALSGKPVTVTVMIPEYFTYEQTVQRLKQKGLINIEKFDKAAESIDLSQYPFLKGLPKREHRLEGYLFPDTYIFDLAAGEEHIIKRMLGRFNQVFEKKFYSKAKKLNMSVDEIVTLASIIEREAKVPEEKDLMAGVFYNRLRSSDTGARKLESCATIQYIFLKRDGKVKERITDQDTKINDPYNTYEFEGLPPGPICSPGLASIEAALNPKQTSYMYFVAKGDGTHYFSTTLWEHNAAAIRYGVN